MRKIHLLRKSERKSVGTTLALTVGSPSFDRRFTVVRPSVFKAKTPCFYAAVFARQSECVGRGRNI